MEKNYQIFLCQDRIVEDKVQENIRVCELGSNTSSHQGKAFNIEFYSKIDGTHDLSFELPEEYFDIDIGASVHNELVDYISAKCKVELYFPDKDKSYFFVINTHKDGDNGQIISHQYTCNDAYIEELSKTGYGINFKDEIGGNGLGTIHELASKILEDSGWEYRADLTGMLYEYKTELEYDSEQKRYNTVEIPQPVLPIEFIPELDRYCYKLDRYFARKVEKGDLNKDGKVDDEDYRIATEIRKEKRIATEEQNLLGDFVNIEDPDNPKRKITLEDTEILKAKVRENESAIENDRPITHNEFIPLGYNQIYAYEDTKQIVSDTVQNMIKNYNDFTDYLGWKVWTWTSLDEDQIEEGWKEKEVSSATLSCIKKEESGGRTRYDLVVENSDGKKYTYLMNTASADTQQTIEADKLYAFTYNQETSAGNIDLYIYEGNPQSSGELKYSLSNIRSGDLKAIKSKDTISDPYFVFRIGHFSGSGNSVHKRQYEDFYFYPIQGKATKDASGHIIKTAEENNITLIKDLTNGIEIDTKYSNIMMTPYSEEDQTISAYTERKLLFFIRDNYYFDSAHGEINYPSEKDTVTYLTFDQVNENAFIYDGSFEEASSIGKHDVNSLPDTPLMVPESNISEIYYNTTDNIYYQYYSLTVNEGTPQERKGSIWGVPFCGNGANDKRRTLVAEKSNRFNLIQNLAELFKVWPVFSFTCDGALTKKEIWFKEKAIRENFSGFHKGVNLTNLERTIDSNEVVTKMYVEDVESEYAEDGFVTIRTSKLNRGGENFYYNFKYYVDQGLLDGEVIESRLNGEGNEIGLYGLIGQYNDYIYEANQKIVELSLSLSSLRAKKESLSSFIAAATERIASLTADTKNPKISNNEKTLAYEKIDVEKANRKKYEKELEVVEKNYNTEKAEHDELVANVEDWQNEKKQLIQDFEKDFLPYIKEGVWSDTSYSDNDTYYLDSQKVSNTSAMPKMTWTISAIDGSVFEELKDFEFEVGDQTILVDDDFFHKDNYTFEVLVSGIREVLDKPENNTIEIRNYLTSFEDLFQRISAATQTLELNEQTYNKGAYFQTDGQIDEDIFQSTLANNSLILAQATDNSYKLDSTGLSLQSVMNADKRLRVLADGIFLANDTDDYGAPNWKTGITADGINASILTAGRINTAVIKIFTEGQETFSWDELGITAYKNNQTVTTVAGKSIVTSEEVDTNSFVRFDQFGLYSVSNKNMFGILGDGSPWYKGETREKAIDLIEENSDFCLTERGFFWTPNINVENTETKGSIRIGYEDKETSSNYGIYVTNTDGVRTVAIDNGGNASFTGDIVANSLKLVGNVEGLADVATSGKYEDLEGGPTLEELGLDPETLVYTKDITISSETDPETKVTKTTSTIKGQTFTTYDTGDYILTNVGLKGEDQDGNEVFFKVSKEGLLEANNAIIHGTIRAGSGFIGGWAIEDGTIMSANNFKVDDSSYTGAVMLNPIELTEDGELRHNTIFEILLANYDHNISMGLRIDVSGAIYNDYIETGELRVRSIIAESSYDFSPAQISSPYLYLSEELRLRPLKSKDPVKYWDSYFSIHPNSSHIQLTYYTTGNNSLYLGVRESLNSNYLSYIKMEHAGKGYLGGTWSSGSSIQITSDINKKHDIDKISNLYNPFFDLLSPVIYKYNDGTSDRFHTGFIAQDVKEALDISSISTQDFAGLVIDNPETEEETWYLRYEEFVALNTWQIQLAKKRISDLESQIAILTEKLDKLTSL